MPLVRDFPQSLLNLEFDVLRQWLLRHWCHRTAKRYRSTAIPLCLLRSSLSRLWLAFRYPLSPLGKIWDDSCLSLFDSGMAFDEVGYDLFLGNRKHETVHQYLAIAAPTASSDERRAAALRFINEPREVAVRRQKRSQQTRQASQIIVHQELITQRRQRCCPG